MAQFDIGAGFAFLNPLGMLLEDRVKLFPGGDSASFQQTIANEENVFDQQVVIAFEFT